MIFEEPWILPESLFAHLDEALEPDDEVIKYVTDNNPEFFTEKGEELGKWIPLEQEAFIKYMIEDKDFLFQVYPLIDQNYFTIPELRDIVRTIKDMTHDEVEVTYPNLSIELLHHYDLSDISKEISWGIVCEVLEECQDDNNFRSIDNDWYKDYFINRLISRLGDVDEKSWC